MSKMLKIVGAAAIAILTVAMAVPAGASPPTPGSPGGYGFDGTAHSVSTGGSDTTYFAMANLLDTYERSLGCAITTSGADAGKCVGYSNGGPADTNTLGNYQHDAFINANPTGSSFGITSMLDTTCGVAYAGTTPKSYAGPPAVSCTNIDMARSSRVPSSTELTNTTGWGYGFDGVQLFTFNQPSPPTPAQNRGDYLQGVYLGTTQLTFNDIAGIYNCTIRRWSDLAGSGIAPGSADDGPIVPWSMNSSSGTYNTFRDFVRTLTSPTQPSFDPNTKQALYAGEPAYPPASGGNCVRKVTAGTGNPLENDVKQLFTEAKLNHGGTLNTDPHSVDNPANWVWWGSWGDMSNFPYKANSDGYSLSQVPVTGKVASGSSVGSTNPATAWPMQRTLYQVTLDTDANCPGGGTQSLCSFNGANNDGPLLPDGVNRDLNVPGATTGRGGAVREFIRWLCRASSTQHSVDPFTGNNDLVEVQGAIKGAGFLLVPTTGGLRSPGSQCRVTT